ncbi:Sec-independent protein translocase protein TatB [Marinicellulosiphila megalodicopiae]|uniref:Sec-independent protein translocase protein TatB n=1 Tax=Marinicellulosiphila megalodicopiae TaxID=2724896 RepID=UPI003BB20437
MFNMSFIEMFVVFTIALLVLGPERLPVAARELGKNIGKLKRFFNNMQRQIDQEIRLEELNRKVMAQLDETQKFIEEQKAKIAEKEQSEPVAHDDPVKIADHSEQKPNNDQVSS